MALRRNASLSLLTAATLALGVSLPASAQSTSKVDTLRVYGPGGPLPAMKEAAAAFSRLHGVPVEVVGGPTPRPSAKHRSRRTEQRRSEETLER